MPDPHSRGSNDQFSGYFVGSEPSVIPWHNGEIPSLWASDPRPFRCRLIDVLTNSIVHPQSWALMSSADNQIKCTHHAYFMINLVVIDRYAFTSLYASTAWLVLDFISLSSSSICCKIGKRLQFWVLSYLSFNFLYFLKVIRNYFH